MRRTRVIISKQSKEVKKNKKIILHNVIKIILKNKFNLSTKILYIN
jgi:hypothetical protein